jgi:hypothetical protein
MYIQICGERLDHNVDAVANGKYSFAKRSPVNWFATRGQVGILTQLQRIGSSPLVNHSIAHCSTACVEASAQPMGLLRAKVASGPLRIQV